MADDRSHVPGVTIPSAGEKAFECQRCGFTYLASQLVLRNGIRVCTIAREKDFPCFDEPGYKEQVTVTPFDPGPLPDSPPSSRFTYRGRTF